MKRIVTALAGLCFLWIGTIASSQTTPVYSDLSLNGTYVFDLRTKGISNNVSVTGTLVGLFTADGNGNITAGQYDVNSGPSPSQLPLPLTGSYSVGADGRGQMLLNINGNTVPHSFVLLSSSQGKLAEMSTSETASGQFQLQSAQTSGITAGTYGVSLSGFLLSQGKNGATVLTPTDWVGQLTADGFANLAGHLDVNVLGAPQPGLTVSGTDTNVVNGRGTGTLGGIPMVFYIVDSSTVYAMSTSAITNSVVWQVAGSLQAQH